MSYRSTILATSGLVGYWRLGEAAASATAANEVVGETGTYTNMLSATGVIAGDADTAMSTGTSGTHFMGITSHTPVAVTVPANGFTGMSFSYEVWIKWTSATLNTFFFGEASGANANPACYLAVDQFGAGKLRIFARNTAGTSTTASTTAAYNDGNPHHVVMTGSGTTIKLYVDGADSGVSFTPPTGSTTLNQLGVGLFFRNSSGSATFGTFDEAAIYNVALSAADILTHYQVGAAADLPSTVSDSSAVTENVQVAIASSNLSITVSDSTAVTEMSDVIRNNSRDVSVLDSSAITENLKLLAEAIVKVSETTLIHEGHSYVVNFNDSNTTMTSAFNSWTNQMTFTTWLNRTDNASNDTIMGSSSTTHSAIIRLDAASNQMRVWTDSALGSATFTTTNMTNAGMTTGSWVWLAVVVDLTNSQVSAYVNNTLVNGSPVSFSNAWNTPGTLQLGAWRSTITDPFKGSLDEFRIFSTALATSEIEALYHRNIVPASVVAEYLFNEGSGTSTADTSGSANTGTLANATWSVSTAPSIFNPHLVEEAFVTVSDSSAITESTNFIPELAINVSDTSAITESVVVVKNLYKDRVFIRDNDRPGLEFDGVDNLVEIPDNSAYSWATNSGLTVSTWIRPDTIDFLDTEGTGYVHFLSKLDTNQNEWTFRMYSQGNTEGRANWISFYVFSASGPTGDGVAFNDVITPGVWMHLVATVDGTQTIHVYRDTVQRGGTLTSGLTLTDQTAPVRLGSGAQNANPNNRSYFLGAMQKVRIYNRAISSSEVTDLFNDVPVTSGLVGEWLLNDGSGTTATDTSSTANSGALSTPAPTWTDFTTKLLVTSAVNVSDSSAVTENVAVSIQGAALSISVSDTSTVTENVPTPTLSYQINKSDTSAVTENVAITVVFNVHRQPDVYQDGKGVVIV